MNRGTLYVVATPLGNLGDLSPRAIEVLRSVDTVVAEDTRRTRPLLAHIGARPRRLVSCHAHTAPRRLERLAASLGAGAAMALLTDAGTPAVSDPGADLVSRARSAGADVIAVPGPSAVTAALSIAGLPADRYSFVGFLPRGGGERRRLLAAAAASAWTVVLFEAAPRLAALLDDLVRVAGAARRAVVARELTKRHEEARAGTLEELAVYYTECPARGEVTLVLEGAPAADRIPAPGPAATAATARAQAREWLREGLSRRDVAARLAGELGLPRREAYRMVTEL